MPLGKKHRLAIQEGQVVIEPEQKTGFVRGMINFYAGALSGAKNKLSGMVKNRNKSGEKAHYDNTDYG